MRQIKRYRFILAGVVTISILVLLRSHGTGRFRYDSNRWAEPSYSASNIITHDEINSLPGDKLIINLDTTNILDWTPEGNQVTIPAASILSRQARKTIKAHDGVVLLWSPDNSTSARAWMLLSQSGFVNLYIIAGGTGAESLNEKFRSGIDTIPEL